ncbi:MAG: squalene synthase HpnC [Zoogloeaceae bacterium]|jgi:squalene synthase HpnC|nr:squalene synthase HpnC [Zoogloeaceae bacterium]
MDHYENFPVASLLLPRALRAPIAEIYRFARMADDIADEGDAPPETRLRQLAAFDAALERIERALAEGTEFLAETGPEPQLFQRLMTVIRRYRLPVQYFRDLLSAFSQDVRKRRYADFPELLDYCRRSANPVGRLILHLRGTPTAADLRRSDAICSALQIINFWQDVAVDWQKGRVYLPQADLRRFGVDEADIAAGRRTPEFCALMRFEVERARLLMRLGAPLARELPGRLGWEIRLTVQGGLRILEKIQNAHYDIFRHRPTLKALDWLCMAKRALLDRESGNGNRKSE